MKILIAEDDQSISDLYSLIFKNRGHQVVITSNGKDCVSMYRRENIRFDDSEFPFDVVILDYAMPFKNGVQVAKEILDLNPNQRIIFISAYPNQMLVDYKDTQKAIEFLNKPFTLPTLLKIVEKKQKTLKDIIPKFQRWDGFTGLSESFGAASSSHNK